jgi:hypothetical protein
MTGNTKYWVGLLASIFAALSADTTLFPPSWHSWLTLLGVLGTAINGYMIQRPGPNDKALMIALVIGGGLLLSSGCGPKIANAQVGQVAQAVTYARQAIAGADAALTTVDQLMSATPPLIPKQEGLAVVQVIGSMGRELQRAAKALELWKAATNQVDRANAWAVAQASIQAAQQAVLQAVVPINDAAARAKVITVLQGVQAALGAIRLGAAIAGITGGDDPAEDLAALGGRMDRLAISWGGAL